MTVSQFLPDNSENKDHIRHKTPLDAARSSPYATPARWYRIHVDYIPPLLALCDYYIHSDAHVGTPGEREELSQWWVDLQILLMTGILVGGSTTVTMEDAFCAKIAECIDNGSLDMTLAASDMRIDGSTSPDEIFPTHPVASVNLIDTCDKDEVYGAVKQTINFLHSTIMDVLETMIAALNAIEMLALAIEAIPIVGSLPGDDMLNFVVMMTENIHQNYEASYNEGLRQEYICDLFCLVLKDCDLDLTKLGTYFMERFTDELFTIDWQDLVDMLLNGTFSGAEMVHAMHAVAAYTLACGVTFGGVQPNFFTAIIKSFTNDPDSDWELLCDECDVDKYIHIQFAESPYLFTMTPYSAGAWEAGVGFKVEGYPEPDDPGIGIETLFSPAVNLTKATVHMEVK
ncbi:hypothetical protein LCGC14_1400210, partial [marine sediment metagenome]